MNFFIIRFPSILTVNVCLNEIKKEIRAAMAAAAMEANPLRPPSSWTATHGAGVLLPLLLLLRTINHKSHNKALNKVAKDLNNTQLFIANGSNRVDQELLGLTGSVHGLGPGRTFERGRGHLGHRAIPGLPSPTPRPPA